ncbi:MAG: hypothetical protein JSS81_18240 [Acidobacteria bacterium]|nr:hypothetical protein [Acidobacteriota bacterium]
MNIIKKNIVCFAVLCAVSLTGACWSADSNTKRRSNSPSASPSGSVSPGGTTDPKTKNNQGDPNSKVNNSPDQTPKSGGFDGNLPDGFQKPTDSVGQRVFKEYGAMFVARGVTPPNKVLFKDESEVSAYQSSVQKSTESIGGIQVVLQTAAMNALKEAIEEAKGQNLSITPRNADSSVRTYQQTVTNWQSRVDPGLTYWVGKGRISKEDASRIKGLPIDQQVVEVLKLEEQGIYFAAGNAKTILYSVAPPGTSQHHSMLALDVAQFGDSKVRAVLARHGWFQTIPSDEPHFTYLGVAESELSNLGLKKVVSNGKDFWVPNI